MPRALENSAALGHVATLSVAAGTDTAPLETRTLIASRPCDSGTGGAGSTSPPGPCCNEDFECPPPPEGSASVVVDNLTAKPLPVREIRGSASEFRLKASCAKAYVEDWVGRQTRKASRLRRGDAHIAICRRPWQIALLHAAHGRQVILDQTSRAGLGIALAYARTCKRNAKKSTLSGQSGSPPFKKASPGGRSATRWVRGLSGRRDRRLGRRPRGMQQASWSAAARQWHGVHPRAAS